MTILEKIKNRTKIDMDLFIARLSKELSIDTISDKDKKASAIEQLEYSIYDIMIIILDVTHQPKVPEGLYTTWLRMVKDYWYLNKYDSQFVSSSETSSDENNNIKIKSIQAGDTTTTFADTSSQVNINGITYNTGTINFSEDVLLEKKKKDLYRHRKMRW